MISHLLNYPYIFYQLSDAGWLV